MADDALRAVLFQLGELGRRMGQMVQFGTVDQVQKDRLRMTLGKDADGKDVKGPWIDTSNHRGGARERRFYKQGQNVTMFMPNGDPSQAMIAPFAPNKNFGPPEQANNSGQNEEVYQFEQLRVRKKGKAYEIWLEPEKNSGQGGGGGEQSGGSSQGQGGSTGAGANEKIMMQPGMITGRVGKSWFVAHKKGAKLKAGKQYAVVTEEQLICSSEWTIGKDPIPEDDKGTPGDDSGGQSSSSSGGSQASGGSGAP